MLAIGIASHFVVPAGLWAQNGGRVHGRVTSETSGVPLAGALVEISSVSGTISTISDSEGLYEMLGVPIGRNLLRARYLGHQPLDLQIVVPAGDVVTVDLSLAIQPVALDPVAADGSVASIPTRASGTTSEAELGIASTHVLGGSPGLAELGLADGGQRRPDQDPGDPGSVLYVRGAATDLKLVYLDGAPVYAPFPLGGLIDPFSPGVLDRADIYLGGAPARYDGGLSYVMDLRSRAGIGEGVRAEGGLDLLSARALVEAGLAGRVGILATARGVHPGAGPNILGDPLPYGYREGFLRADAVLAPTTSISLTGFGNNERVGLGESAGRDSTIQWGNRAGSVRLRTSFARTTAEVTAATGDYFATLPLPGDQPLLAEGSARRARLAADLASSTRGLLVRYGASVDRQRYRASTTPVDGAGPGGYSAGGGTVAGVYVEGAGQLGDRLRLRLGGRVDHFSTTGEATFGPRFAATLLVTDRAALTLAAGRYHQFLRPPDETLLAGAGAPAQLMSRTLTVGSADHLVVSLDQDLGENVRLGIEGFYKNFSDVPGSLSLGANASGVDFWVRKASGGWTGWLGYSLAWAWSAGGADDGSAFTGRHLLSSGLLGHIGARTAVELRFAYGAGLPFSPIPLDPGENLPNRNSTNFTSAMDPQVVAADRGGTETAPLLETPDQPFLRIDVGVSQTWMPRIAGRTTELNPYLKLLNGLGRRDALFYYYDADSNDRPRPIGGLPIIPVAGLEWRF